MPGNAVFTGSGLGSGVGLELGEGSGLAAGDGLEDGTLGDGDAPSLPAGANGPASSRQATAPPRATTSPATTGQNGIRLRTACRGRRREGIAGIIPRRGGGFGGSADDRASDAPGWR